MTKKPLNTSEFIKKTIKILLLISILILIFKLSLIRIPASDIWWQMHTGKLILSEHHFPYFDSCSFTVYDQPWVEHEWLAGVIFYYFYETFGEESLFYLKYIILASTYLLLFFLLERNLKNPIISFFITAFSAFVSSNFFDIRPQIFTYLFTIMTLFCLDLKNKKITLILLPIILLFWVNIHGAFVIFFIFIFFYLINSWKDIKDKNYSDVKPVIIGSIIALICSGINPYFYSILLYPIKWIGKSTFKSTINEWTAISSGDSGYYLYLLLLFVGVILLIVSIKNKKIGHTLAIIFFIYLSINSKRHLSICSIYFAAIIGVHFHKLKFDRFSKFFTPYKKLLLSFIIFFISSTYLLSSPLPPDLFKYTGVDEIFPYKATEYIQKKRFNRI